MTTEQNINYGESEMEEAQLFGFSGRHCVRTCGEFRKANGKLGFACLQTL
jgi:hypothetical protein